MITLFQKIFSRKNNKPGYNISTDVRLSPEQMGILNTIEQNADCIRFNYGHSDTHTFNVFSIIKSDPVLEICSVREITPSAPNGIITYNYEKRAPDGYVLAAHSGKGTDFARMIYSKLLDKFNEHNNVIVKEQAKQH